MRTWLAVAALASLVAVPKAVFADAAQHLRYQLALLKRALPTGDKAYCDQQVGAQADNPAEYDKCHVTRLFVNDLYAGKDQGFPPLTEIKYLKSQDEQNKVLDAMGKYGG